MLLCPQDDYKIELYRNFLFVNSDNVFSVFHDLFSLTGLVFIHLNTRFKRVPLRVGCKLLLKHPLKVCQQSLQKSNSSKNTHALISLNLYTPKILLKVVPPYVLVE